MCVCAYECVWKCLVLRISPTCRPSCFLYVDTLFTGLLGDRSRPCTRRMQPSCVKCKCAKVKVPDHTSDREAGYER